MKRLIIAFLSIGLGTYIGISMAVYMSFDFVRYVPQVSSLSPLQATQEPSNVRFSKCWQNCHLLQLQPAESGLE